MENGVTRKTSRPARILIIEPAITNNVACHGHFIRVEYLRNFVRRRKLFVFTRVETRRFARFVPLAIIYERQ